jgi:hypothetical protein
VIFRVYVYLPEGIQYQSHQSHQLLQAMQVPMAMAQGWCRRTGVSKPEKTDVEKKPGGMLLGFDLEMVDLNNIYG